MEPPRALQTLSKCLLSSLARLSSTEEKTSGLDLGLHVKLGSPSGREGIEQLEQQTGRHSASARYILFPKNRPLRPRSNDTRWVLTCHG